MSLSKFLSPEHSSKTLAEPQPPELRFPSRQTKRIFRGYESAVLVPFRPPVVAGFRYGVRDFRFPAPEKVSSIVLGRKLLAPKLKCIAYKDEVGLTDEDDDLCPVDCVKEFKTDEELFKTLEKAKETNSLVVVDFFRTSCGSCKYIEQGFSKLCKVSGYQQAGVIFLKHNVMDEYDEQSETADRLRIKAVPLFHFYKNGVLLEAFATRDKARIDEAIRKYTSSSPTAA